MLLFHLKRVINEHAGGLKTPMDSTFLGGTVMNINYNVTGSDRKRLVSVITRMTGKNAAYEGVPSIKC